MAEDDSTFKVWIILLATCKEDGISKVSVPYIARICNKSKDEIRRCLNILESPDTDSRSTNDEGKRIQKVDGGFRIINYWKYRNSGYANDRHTEDYDKNGYVYFAKFQDRIKIGHSVNPWARMSELKIAIPDIELIFVLKGARSLEQDYHNKFNRFRIKGEWFLIKNELATFINENIKNTSQKLPVATVVGTVSASASSSASGINSQDSKRVPIISCSDNPRGVGKKYLSDRERQIATLIEHFKSLWPPNGEAGGPNVDDWFMRRFDEGFDFKPLFENVFAFAEYWKWREPEAYPYKYTGKAENWLVDNRANVNWAERLQKERLAEERKPKDKPSDRKSVV
jgi:hypothetical protein